MSATEQMIAGVAGRYATALFELARDEKQLDDVARDMNGFIALLDESADLDRLVHSPAFGQKERGKALARVLDKAGVKGLMPDFLGLVASNNRLFVIRDMARAYNGLLAAHKGEMSATVISAVKLTSDQQDELAKALKSTTKQDVKIKTRIDPDLLGGLVIKVGSKMIDTSLRTKLNNLRVVMKEGS